MSMPSARLCAVGRREPATDVVIGHHQSCTFKVCRDSFHLFCFALIASDVVLYPMHSLSNGPKHGPMWDFNLP
jgi:hypothetical protein